MHLPGLITSFGVCQYNLHILVILLANNEVPAQTAGTTFHTARLRLGVELLTI